MKKIVSIMSALVMLLLVTMNAAADSWMPPVPFKIWSEDGSRIFRFDPKPENTYNDDSLASAAVYNSVTSSDAIYKVENLRSWAYENDFFFSHDLQFFAFIPPAGFDTAIEFYSNGRLIESYKINDLVKDKDKVERSTSKSWWQNGRAEISQDHKKLTLKTVDDSTYVFDIETGGIIESDKPLDTSIIRIIIYTLISIAGICIAACAIFVLIRRKRKP